MIAPTNNVSGGVGQVSVSSGRFAPAMVFLLLNIAHAPASSAQTQNEVRKPTAAFSIAHTKPGASVDGPLFHQVEAAFTAANDGDGGGFRRFLAPNSELQLVSFSDSKLQRSPFTVQTIRAATKSCMGPFSFDEGKSWAQLSWVCRVDSDAPLSSILSFRNSPELSLTIWFAEGLIKRIDAMEPIPIPGMPLVAMDAFATMQSNR